MDRPIRLGVSACLLGQPVRFDATHKYAPWIAQELGRHVELLPVCPEAEAGFGTPREAMRLTGDPEHPRLVTVHTGRDMTRAMREYCAKRVEELAAEDLCGFIFKSKSPSSGMARVKVYPETGGSPILAGTGIFAKAFMRRFPLLPVEEDARLDEPHLRENFIERIVVLRAWRGALLCCGQGAACAQSPASQKATAASRQPAEALSAFHARHKLTLMAHSPAHLKSMGSLIAAARQTPPAELAAHYGKLLLEALDKPATPGRHANVLSHMAGYFRGLISPEARRELDGAIREYRQGLTPRIVPMTLIRHHVHSLGHPYLASQSYMHQHPLELALRGSC